MPLYRLLLLLMLVKLPRSSLKREQILREKALKKPQNLATGTGVSLARHILSLFALNLSGRASSSRAKARRRWMLSGRLLDFCYAQTLERKSDWGFC